MPFPNYRQLDQKDCGPTCLKIIAKHYGKIISLSQLRDLCGLNREGVSFQDLSHAAESIGLRTLALEVTLAQLQEKLPLPCIVHWQANHFVVVYKTSATKVYVSDPVRGLVTYGLAEFQQQWVGTGGQTGLVLAVEPQPHFFTSSAQPNERQTVSAWRSAVGYLRPYRAQIYQLLGVMLLLTLMQGVLPFFFRAIVDVGIGRRDLTFINVLLVANVVLILSIALGNLVRDWLLKHVAARFSIALISDYLIKLLRMPLAYFETRTSGDVLQRVSDHERIKTFLLNQSLGVIFALLSLGVFSGVLLVFSTALFFIFTGGSLLYIGWVLLFTRFQEKLDGNFNELNAQNQSYWVEMLSSVTDIKINNYDQKKRWKWENIQADLYQLNLRFLSVTHIQEIGSQLINGLKNVFLTFYSAKAVLTGEMSLGVMISTQFIIGFLNGPISQFIGFLQSANMAKLSFARLQDIQQLVEEEATTHHFPVPADHTLELRNAFFQYARNKVYSLSGITLRIPHGKVTAIVGESGSGKSTLLKLLLRLYEPSRGSISVGGAALGTIGLRAWRDRCAAVLQEGRIFNDTLLNNVMLDDDHPDYEKLQHVIRATALTEVVDALPLGYHTRIGEKGMGLSQGQKQRILIARALYREPDYLFLDEATNALDAVSEAHIMRAFAEGFRGKTVVVAAHRLSTILNADQIVVMHRGLIAETGTHAELLLKKGYYHRLVYSQMPALLAQPALVN